MRVDSLRAGSRFLSIHGETYRITRQDGVSHVVSEDGHATLFAGCAEVVLLPK